jgi:hypothetical protein
MNPNINWDNPEDPDLDDFLNEDKIKSFKSKHPLEKLRSNLKINTMYAIIITVSYIVVIIIFPIWQVQLALVLGSVFNIWSIIKSFAIYKSIDIKHVSDLSLMDTMKKQMTSIHQWLDLGEKAALFMYPIGTIGGFLLGAYLGSGLTVEQFMTQRMYVILIIAIMILTPLTHMVAKYFNKIAFRRHLDDLEIMINELKEE